MKNGNLCGKIITVTPIRLIFLQRNMRMKYIMITVISAAVIVLLLFFILLFVSSRVFGRGKPYDITKALRKNPELAEEILAKRKSLGKYSPEEVSVKSFDGYRLVGKIYYSQIPDSVPERGFVVCMHGYHSGAAEDFAGAVDFFTENRFHVLFVTQRCHGESEGNRITFGAKERYDCRTWCEYLVGRFGKETKIILDGISMGAATVVMAADREVGLPANVKAVIADCGYTSPWEIVCDVAKKTYHLPKFPVMHIFRLAVRIDAGFDLCSVSAEKAAANTDIPIFFAHGTGDKFVPYEMSVRNQRAHAAESYLFSVENAGHGLSFMIDRENYSRECMNFLEKFL